MGNTISGSLRDAGRIKLTEGAMSNAGEIDKIQSKFKGFLSEIVAINEDTS